MEQKRTLLIVAAVGIFLLVVLGAAIILNSASSAASKSDTSNSVSTITSDWITPDSQISTISSVQDLNQDNTASADAAITTDTPITTVDNGIIFPAGSAVVTPQPTTTVTQTSTGNVTATTDAAATAMQQTSTYVPTTTTPSVTITQNNYASQSAPVTVITPKPVETKKATAKATTTKPVAKAGKYWVQVGSFSKKSGADSTRSSLSSQGIQSEIFTYTTSDGSTGYRVRVGPYQTKSEAEYWMKLVEEKTGTKGYIAETK